jgi:hypothetical protein
MSDRKRLVKSSNFVCAVSHSGSSNTAHSLIDRSGCLRQQARKYREVYNTDYPLPDNINVKDNSADINEQLDYLKNMIIRTNLQYDNIRPIFISLEILKK